MLQESRALARPIPVERHLPLWDEKYLPPVRDSQTSMSVVFSLRASETYFAPFHFHREVPPRCLKELLRRVSNRCYAATRALSPVLYLLHSGARLVEYVVLYPHGSNRESVVV